MRTSDQELALACKQLAKGCLSAESFAFLQATDRPLMVSDSQKVVLFSKNFDSWAYNGDCLNKFPGEARLYLAEESGDKRALKQMRVAKVTQADIFFVLQVCYQSKYGL